MNDEQRLAILDEIIAVTTLPQRKQYQFTRREYQKRSKKLSRWQAQHELDQAVMAGTLRKERRYADGRKAIVYCRPED